jgi:hypothetical protein
MRIRVLLFLATAAAALGVWSTAAGACGGFFCQNSPVDQVGERIVFSVNPDETVTSLIEILYFGEADDFSWILPIPEAIEADALAVPEDGDLVFDELHTLTDVQVIAPDLPGCADEFLASAAMSDSGSADDGVEIFGSGEVGPFGFDIIGSESPDALITWLRDNNYQVTPDMEPLINVYVEDRFAFIAMRLLDGETSDSISPIEITYPGSEPMIPIRLTAVAAQPNMPIWVWIFGESRAVPTNYADLQIATEEISFFPSGGNDYTFLVQQRADALDGQAFITEFAQPSETLDFEHEWLQANSEAHPYLTRLNTYIDPPEMTVDPIFGFDDTMPDVSNVRDASDLDGLYDCERRGDDGVLDRIFGGSSDAIDPMDGTQRVVAFTPGREIAAENEPVDDTPPIPEDHDDEAQAVGADTPASSDGLPTGVVVALVAAALVAGAGGATLIARRR